ncbi:MAG: peptidylprolyl isomerase, partial [Acidimicrobiales bacterium]|nr:peptidylprolyl isomerase [Acidimicrobiales bacterium]
CSAVPSDKPQRQRENSRARQEAAIAAAAQQKRRTRIILGVVAALALGGAAVFAMQGGDDGGTTTEATDTATSTTVKGATTTTLLAGDPETCPPAEGTTERFLSFSKAPKMCIDEDKTYTALLKTDLGDIEIALRTKDAPKTVNNFVFLARNKFYDGVVFHRVVTDFMDQTGDPEGTGRGGPGYKFDDEVPSGYTYKAGDVAMANSGPNTNGSQFFLVASDNGAKALTASYSPFGTVTKGIDVVTAINNDGSPDQAGTPKVLHKITSVTITEE